MDWVVGGAGALMVLLVLTDIGLTVLHPGVSGPLTMWLTRATWATLRPVSTRFVGPAALGLAFGAWIVGLWVGFALVFLPFEDHVRGAAGEWGVGDALYLSGESLTTVGFGDLVPVSEALRIVTVVEAVSGLAAITAAITYLLSLFAVLSELRVAASRVSDLRATEPRWAASLAIHGGPGEVQALQRDVLAAEEHLRRFPVLFFFHPRDHNYAMSLLDAAAVVCVVLRWGIRPERLPYAADYGRGLQRSLDRVRDALREDFALPGAQTGPLDAEDAGARLARVRRALAELDAELPQAGPPDAELRTFLGMTDRFLADIASTHALEHRALLSGDGSDRRAHEFAAGHVPGKARER